MSPLGVVVRMVAARLPLPAPQEAGQMEDLAIRARDRDRHPTATDGAPLVEMTRRDEDPLAEEEAMVVGPDDRGLGANIEEPALAAIDAPADDIGAVGADGHDRIRGRDVL